MMYSLVFQRLLMVSCFLEDEWDDDTPADIARILSEYFSVNKGETPNTSVINLCRTESEDVSYRNQTL